MPVAYSNLRGVCYILTDSENATHPFALSTTNYSPALGGGPEPSIAFPQLKSFGINVVRLDGFSWHQRELHDADWSLHIKAVADEADKTGSKIMWGNVQGAWGGGDVRHFLPDLLCHLPSGPPAYYSGGNTDWRSEWADKMMANTVYWGSGTYYDTSSAQWVAAPWAAKYSGKPLWQCVAEGMYQASIPELVKHPSTLALNLQNEPGQNLWSDATSLKNCYQYMATKIRAYGWTGYVAYMPCSDGWSLNDLKAVAPLTDTSGNSLQPLILNVHYPYLSGGSHTSQLLPDFVQACSDLSVAGWDGEDTATRMIGAGGDFPDAADVSGYAPVVYKYAYDGTLLDPYLSGGQPTATFTSLSNAYYNAYGAAQFDSPYYGNTKKFYVKICPVGGSP